MDKLPDSLHFAGIGGIGMSGLAQMALALGHEVSGSDRAYGKEENKALFDALISQNAKIFPQDGSRYEEGEQPGAMVYSTAVEKTNADFEKAPSGMELLHRSQAMALAIKELKCENNFAVAGTCGKTSVTAHLAEALKVLGADPGVLCGGLVNAFKTEKMAGNFAAGAGKYFVIEADESDKSLLNYPVDAAMVLNIGTDHYSREELCQVFGQFLMQTSRIAVIQDDAYLEMKNVLPPPVGHLEKMLFSTNGNAPSNIDGIRVIKALDYQKERSGAFTVKIDGMRTILPAPGLYTAANACAVYTSLLLLGFAPKDAIEAVQDFHGVWRRFDLAGKMENGAKVYDDYAHNVEKILSCLSAAKEVAEGRVFALFQPHGFAPLSFMREELFARLENYLSSTDVFGFLPVYYAGGSASFTPTSDEVVLSYIQKTNSPGGRMNNYISFADRNSARDYVRKNAKAGDVVLIMGARDNSLSFYAKILADS